MIIARDVWRGRLWSATPCTVVEDDGETLVAWVPAGTVIHASTSRGIPERDGLSRGDRQLLSMETGEWRDRDVAANVSGVNVVRAQRWSRVAPVWSATGAFLHWYVNFQLPPTRVADGFETMDLVLDLVVAPDGTWREKDREDFDAAVERGILEPSVVAAVATEAELVLAELAARTGGFDRRWYDAGRRYSGV